MLSGFDMRIAIMQPYFFPYLGYFQLIHAVDTFIYLDDVAFIKKGWIHRNRLYFNKKTYLFSIPIKNISQHKSIRETTVSDPEFSHWKKKFFSSLCSFYKKQPYFNEGFEIVNSVFETPFNSIAELAINSIKITCDAVGLNIPRKCSSEIETIHGIKKENLIIEICRIYNCDVYVNPPGGVLLYRKEMFAKHGISLRFIQPNLQAYPAENRDFVPGLSVLDALMCCGKRYTRDYLLSGYTLVEGT